MQVYRLVSLVADDYNPPAKNGKRAVCECALGVFSTVENAEKMIGIEIERRKRTGEMMLGYVLYENTLDDLALHGPWKMTPEFLTVRTYLADGTLNAFSDCDDACEKQWRGRDATTIRFKDGDFVSVWSGGGYVCPALVGMTPYTTDKGFVGDWTDDCYMTYDVSGGHSHPFTPYVFPLVGELTAEVKAKLEAARDRDEKETD